ncbi:nucleotide exchange factor GrpE [Aureispira sp. CCB-E]|uniref:nucleotide exchange factor GrpE n=1 Tax=Aureispira sp. CCB-E TaxID=3051121 RepID=UPI002868427F|nr:nucleotide exchange factor GrpE [Aureispira sp. CCB-E]WMX15010.1 nucleotide exchange factor GrpE [Aureispira sp. CCB-E]
MNKKEIPVDGPENEETLDNVTTEETNNTTEDSTVDNTSEETTPEQEQNAEEVASTKENEEKEESKLSETERLQKELGEMKDKYLRIFAEFDNYRKRTIKERQDIIKLAAKDSLAALLPAVDDFSRAIDNEESMPEGVILIYNKLYKALEQQGIKEMETTGQDFDPELHEALTKIPAPSEELKGKIIDTIEKGYYLNDKIIRYAKVVVGE